jgi:hypothetical protein
MTFVKMGNKVLGKNVSYGRWFFPFFRSGFTVLFISLRLFNHKTKTGNWFGHILGRNCLLKSVVEGKIGRKGRRRRRRKQLMYEDTET